MRFTKMQGLGNDYVFLNFIDKIPDDLPNLAIKLSNRHFGIGSDGIICIEKSNIADFKMEIYNQDGSCAEMCGNGIRCVGKLLYDEKLTDKTNLTIETGGGIRNLELNLIDGKIDTVTVDMGKVKLGEKLNLFIDDLRFTGYVADVGNPHFVILSQNIDDIPLDYIGAKLERHSAFRNRSNIEFCEIISRDKFKLRVWERGSGITKACGTGACASFAVIRSVGRCNDKVVAEQTGGDLFLEYKPDSRHIFMGGDAVKVFDGELEI